MKRKVIRAITGLLCAAMVFSNVAGMSVYAMEDGGGQEMQESISGNDDTGEVWEEPEEAEQESADSDEEPEAEIPEDPDETYAAGDDITAYYFTGDSLLYFDGTGPMKDWSTPVTRPWNNIKPAVCVIGNFAFQQNSEMDTLILPDGLERIGERAFLGCHALTSIDIQYYRKKPYFSAIGITILEQYFPGSISCPV